MVAPILQGAQILWVDDTPGNNIYERMVLKSMGIIVDIAITTNEALLMLSMSNYDAAISDMERYGNNNAGLQLLHKIEGQDLDTQVIFYTGRVDRDRGTPTRAFGITSYPDDLIHYVLDVLERGRL
jgi:DNA-binding NtrC family response regulator